MVSVKDLLRPTGLKIILSLTLLIPSLILAFIILGYTIGPWIIFQSIAVPIFFGIVISYLISSFIDYFIKNRSAKIVIASASGMFSIIVGYLIYRLISEPIELIICDPVHKPSDCELACEQIVQNATNRTAEVMQKFEECMRNC